MIIEVTDANFNQTVIGPSNSKLVVIHVWDPLTDTAEYYNDVVEEIFRLWGMGDINGAIVGRLNSTKNPQVKASYGINSAPAYLFFDRGILRELHFGNYSLSELDAKVLQYVSA